jgi:hypothetical protein
MSQFPHGSRSEAADQVVVQKKAPENRGQVWEERLGLNPVAPSSCLALARPAGLRAQDTEDHRCGSRWPREPSAGDRRSAIGGGHHAAKQRGRRHEAERGGIGHECPLMAVQRVAAFLQSQLRYARCHMQLVCLHGSILHFAMHHRTRAAQQKKAAGNRRPSRPRKMRFTYSAASLRGGSSAPESWISAT